MWDLWWTKSHWGRFFRNTEVSLATHSTDCSRLGSTPPQETKENTREPQCINTMCSLKLALHPVASVTMTSFGIPLFATGFVSNVFICLFFFLFVSTTCFGPYGPEDGCSPGGKASWVWSLHLILSNTKDGKGGCILIAQCSILYARVPGYRSRGPGSIPGATKVSEK
jgi:hypothetical protein